ncbi:phenylalanine--tRNA ligase alpha subunit [Galendromus occidentalis]|uniref:phenylalanine--tRNA ligase n=1 Tax=Galendromus occidentalis TaxID=34638 RepID=A0AAJ6QUV4_9ACAR|nr:phenylalanine--tRNA ligase alpha subunit [Galendromus occidentalis]
MATLVKDVLALVGEKNELTSAEAARILSQDHQKIVGAVKSILCFPGIIEADLKAEKSFELTAEGKQIAQDGSHEAAVYNAVPIDGGIKQPDLMKLVGASGKVGFSKAMSNGWITLDKSHPEGPRISRKVDKIQDEVKSILNTIHQGSAQVDTSKLNDLKKRKLIQEVQVKIYVLRKGPDFKLELEKQETDLTAEMIASGEWETKSFKEYNFDAMGIQPDRGHLHPLLKVRAEFRQIFLEMGFTEMPTNRFVESSFWNFDALFQPQQHPARDAHDTFFISDPATCTNFPEDYAEIVRKTHSKGGYESLGYNYDWQYSEAEKNLLRTHTTAVSARMLYKLAKDGFKPSKFFSIDRVFRNETLDATHLAEFHQIEGVVADRKLTLGNLMGVIKAFFDKLGIKKLRFKPAYNPYTEPSMEIFSYHEGLQKWVEVGNSGMFRPEMLLPMGLPPDVKVIAWGLSLERPTMIKYGIDNIRDLVGHKVDLQMVYNNPICRLDKE